MYMQADTGWRVSERCNISEETVNDVKSEYCMYDFIFVVDSRNNIVPQHATDKEEEAAAAAFCILIRKNMGEACKNHVHE